MPQASPVVAQAPTAEVPQASPAEVLQAPTAEVQQSSQVVAQEPTAEVQQSSQEEKPIFNMFLVNLKNAANAYINMRAKKDRNPFQKTDEERALIIALTYYEKYVLRAKNQEEMVNGVLDTFHQLGLFDKLNEAKFQFDFRFPPDCSFEEKQIEAENKYWASVDLNKVDERKNYFPNPVRYFTRRTGGANRKEKMQKKNRNKTRRRKFTKKTKKLFR